MTGEAMSGGRPEDEELGRTSGAEFFCSDGATFDGPTGTDDGEAEDPPEDDEGDGDEEKDGLQLFYSGGTDDEAPPRAEREAWNNGDVMDLLRLAEVVSTTLERVRAAIAALPKPREKQDVQAIFDWNIPSVKGIPVLAAHAINRLLGTDPGTSYTQLLGNSSLVEVRQWYYRQARLNPRQRNPLDALELLLVFMDKTGGSDRRVGDTQGKLLSRLRGKGRVSDPNALQATDDSLPEVAGIDLIDEGEGSLLNRAILALKVVTLTDL